MTIYLDQSAALDARLSVMADVPPVAWEGVEYAPVDGTLFLKPSLRPNGTIAKTERDETRGVYLIDIFAPAGSGKREALIMTDKIANHFKHGTELTYNGVNVLIDNVHRDDGRKTGDGWYNISVLIDYYSFTTRR